MKKLQFKVGDLVKDSTLNKRSDHPYGTVSEVSENLVRVWFNGPKDVVTYDKSGDYPISDLTKVTKLERALK